MSAARGILGRLHRDERGQITVLTALGAIGMVLLVAMVFNTGTNVVRRTETQNAADAAAMTQATWTARSLNLMAMNNTGLVQAFSVSVVSAALTETLIDAGARAAILAVKYAAELGTCMPNVVKCAEVVLKSIDLAGNVIWPLLQVAREKPWGAADDFKHIALGLGQMNATLVEEFPDWSARMARTLAEKNGVEPPVFYAHDVAPPYASTPLPVEKGPLLDTSALGMLVDQGRTLCRTAEDGTRDYLLKFYETFQEHGYEDGKGVYEAVRENANEAIHGALEAIHRAPHDQYEQDQSEDENRFTRAVDFGWQVACTTQRLPLTQLTASVPGPKVDLWVAKHRPDVTKLLGTDQALREKMSLLAFVRQPGKIDLFSGAFRPAPESVDAYAQAEVYHAGGTYDLFTHDWRARLVPAFLVESDEERPPMLAVLRAKRERLHDVLLAMSASELELLNAH